MANGVPEFNQQANLARVAAGWKGGPFAKNLNLAPSMKIVEGRGALADEKLMAGSFPQPTPVDPWVARYPNAKIK